MHKVVRDQSWKILMVAEDGEQKQLCLRMLEYETRERRELPHREKKAHRSAWAWDMLTLLYLIDIVQSAW